MRWMEIHEATPTDTMKAAVYYHGCSDEGKARSILQTGISPQDIAIKGMKARGKMTPVQGRVYVTSDISYAITYALGGVFAGRTPPTRFTDQFGYLFVIPGSELTDIQPDEDSVGEFFYHHGESPNRFSRDPIITFKGDAGDKLRVWHFIYDAMTPLQRAKAIQAEYSAWAAGGKRALKTMPDWMKLRLIEWGAHVANTGPVIPTEAWKIDKTRSMELEPDGSNFRSIAERVK